MTWNDHHRRGDVLRAVEDAERDTGRRALYVPNLIGTPERVLRQFLAYVGEPRDGESFDDDATGNR